jgi:hypothetical protein
MSIMHIALAIPGKAVPQEVEAAPFSIRMKDGVFAVVTPDFDDWNQTQNFDLRTADASIRFEAGKMIIQFPDAATRNAFRQWLQAAIAKARQGYRTMWP